MDLRSNSVGLVPAATARPELAYLDTGDGPATLLLHSLGTDHRLWTPQLAPLADGFRVVAPDSRGHGRSGWTGDLDLDAWTDDLTRVLDHLDLTDVALVGVSMGGVQALAYALRHPERVRALVLADTFAELDADVADTKIAAMSEQARSLGMAAFADRYVADTFTTDPPVAEAELVRDAIAGVPLDAYLAAVRTCFGVRLADRLGEITAPTLVLWGDRDQKTPRPLAEKLTAGLPNAVLREVPDAGHLANLENPDFFHSAVRDHLA